MSFVVLVKSRCAFVEQCYPYVWLQQKAREAQPLLLPQGEDIGPLLVFVKAITLQQVRELDYCQHLLHRFLGEEEAAGVLQLLPQSTQAHVWLLGQKESL